MGQHRVYLPRFLPLLAVLILTTGLAIILGGTATQPSAAAPVWDNTGEVSKNRPAKGSAPEMHCVPEWDILPAPNIGPGRNQLLGVAAISAGDVWAVGTYLDWPYQPIIEHWDGTQWSAVPTPHLDGAAVLRGIATVAPNDIWAVGY